MNAIINELIADIKLQLKDAIEIENFARIAKLASYIVMLRAEEDGVAAIAAVPEIKEENAPKRRGRRKIKADAPQRPKRKYTRRVESVRNGEKKAVKIAKGPYAVEINESGWTPVDIAAAEEQSE